METHYCDVWIDRQTDNIFGHSFFSSNFASRLKNKNVHKYKTSLQLTTAEENNKLFVSFSRETTTYYAMNINDSIVYIYPGYFENSRKYK